MAAEFHCLPPDIRARVRGAWSGGLASQAYTRATDLLQAGAGRLVSFGIAGGLEPGLTPGTVVIPRIVLAPDGTRYETDAEEFARLSALLEAIRIPYVTRPILGVDRPVTDRREKRALYDRWGAAACDMESHHAARAARRITTPGGLPHPFVTVRVISDPAHRTLPSTALLGLSATGEVDTARVLGALLRRPWEIPAMAGLGLEAARAFRRLRRLGALGVL